MATYVMNLDEWVAQMKRLGKQFRPTVIRGIRAGALRTLPILQQSTRTAPAASKEGKTGAVDTGNYLRRWTTRPLANGVEIVNTAAYSGVIEEGRRPGRFPPLADIERWAKRRLHLTAEQAREAAFPIARAIARRGLKPRKVMGRVEKKIIKGINDEVRFELKQIRGAG